ncbi:MAG: hypothetical protein ACPIA4_04305, partial [Flavobacteriales bacterium]
MDSGESFTLKLYDSSEDEYLTYESSSSIITFDSWSNTNGAPMASYNDANEIYNFISLIEVNLSLNDSVICTNENSFNFSGGTPEGGEYFINGINSSQSSPSDWNSGFQEVSYIYENDTASQNVYFISEPDLTIETTTNSAQINFSPLLTIDQYRFRYRALGTSEWSVVGLDVLDGVTTNDSTKSLNNLSSCTTYEIQSKIWSTSGCILGWSDIHYFTTSYFNSLQISACDSLAISETFTVYESGTYYENLIGINGCDSTIEHIVDINFSSSSNENITTCNIYEWNGEVYTESGSYTYTTLNSLGCDSTATLILTINASSTSSQEVIACDFYQWNGEVYTESGIYTFSTLNSLGCDSTATLNLTINASSTSSEEVVACDIYLLNGEVYTESGVYTFSSINTSGCDSIATLNITINYSSSSYQEITACNSFEWNGTNYTESGTYTYTNSNASGCDSVSVLNLT